MDKAKFLYICMLALRFIFTLLPQTGYLHPDEYFQSSEVVYGDVFKLFSQRTWEFETDEPIRSIAFPYIIIGIPAMLMNLIFGNSFLEKTLAPYLLLVMPRLFMCLISLIHDFCILKLCKMLGKNPFHALVIFASSYVTLVHFTRTFSNTLEAACFTLLSYFVAIEIARIMSIDKREASNEHFSYKNGSGNFYEYGILFMFGCFMRPTFLAFSVIPLTALILLNFNNHIIPKILQCAIGAIVTALLLSVVDTVYYRHDFSLVYHFNVTVLMQNLILTPLNFILYNIDVNKLSQHGYHPRYMHFLLNIHIMFPLLGIYWLAYSFGVLLRTYRRRVEGINKLKLFMLLSVGLPICALSIIPHQESRFLLPLMFPLICLCGEQLYLHCSKYKFIAFLWCITNVAGLVTFGFFHQGGMFSALSYFHTMTVKDTVGTFDLVFYHTYMPPRHLVAIRDSQKKVTIHDLAGSSDEILLSTIQMILQKADHNNKVYIISPSSVTIPIVNVNIMLSPHHKVRLERKFFPHLSTEDLPVFYNLWNVLTRQSSLYYKLRRLKDHFCLNIYRVEPVLNE